MRLTIERLRTLVLTAGVLLIVALGVFLSIGKWRNPLNKRDLPQRLGVDIRQEANGWTYTHELHGRTLYKIHASKLVQLKQGSHVLLHDVKIELYGEDGRRTDRIEGSEFEYDPENGIAKAAGPVEITLMRPGVAPAIAPNASPTQLRGDGGSTLAAAAQAAERGEIAVKTSGLTFDRNTGAASTSEKVQFALTQGIGSAIGALYDGHRGQLVLDRAVQMIMQRADETVVLNARHAEFERTEQVCDLIGAKVGYREDEARAERARVFFRDDGTAVRLEASEGVTLSTSTGGQVTAPTGLLEFNENNQPHQGRLWGGVTIDSDHDGRKLHGTAPTMAMQFAGQGELRSLHLERDVQIASDEQTSSAQGVLRTHRTWASPVADVEFRSAGHRSVEPASIHGSGGVVVTAQSQRDNAPPTPSRLAADDVTGSFGPGGRLQAMTGTGHASVTQMTPAGTRQTTSGEKLTAHFSSRDMKDKTAPAPGSGMEIQSATIDGDVVLVQQPAAKAGAPDAAPLRATAGRASYEGAGEWLHLTESPRVVNGGLELTADKIDVSQASGEAFAYGSVKATWNGDNSGSASGHAKGVQGQTTVGFGGQGPAHIVADEAQLRQSTGEAIFKGNARLWQQANSIAAPVIALDRTKQTLIARGTSASAPVQVVLVSAGGVAVPTKQSQKGDTPSVVRVRGGDFKYSSAERKAFMRGSSAGGGVVASTADAKTTSNEMELVLMPPGNHAGKDGTAAQVDRMTSSGNVAVTSQGRRGTGEKLVYSGETGDYVLTGTAAAPPKITDTARGTITGEALIFNGRDDSVRIEGGGRRTTTVTTAPK